MTKRLAIVFVALFILVGLFSTSFAQGTKYGAGVTLTSATPVSKVLADPKAFIGKTIRVDGIVTAVCDKAGCWMELRDESADPKAAQTLRMKVDDGVIVFPVSAAGKKASAEGVFEVVSAEAAAEHAAHAAQEAKDAKPADAKPAAAQEKTALPKYQVKATGAVIY
jgi:hypothetical protein